jgi:teichuronic acid biosynthesis glycosyltransferase TuaC
VKIAVVTTSYPRDAGDPAGHFVQAEVDSLAELGHQVTVLAPGSDYTSSGNVRVLGVPDGGAFGWPGALTRLRARPTRLVGAARFVHAARKQLWDLGPLDRVIAHWFLPSAYPIALAAPLGIPLEVVAHGSDVRVLTRAPRAMRHAILETLLPRVLAIRFVSEELLTSLTNSLDPQLARQLVKRSRVEPAPLSLGPVRSRALARSRLGLDPSKRYCLIVARLVREKRVDVALSALALLPDVEIVVVGEGPELSRLESEFPSVRFTGKLPRPDALDYVSAADVVVSVSRSEGAPSVVREARALGTDVVSVDVGDVRHWAASDPGIWLVSSR